MNRHELGTHSGIGMTSARTRDRLVQRLRSRASTTCGCWTASATCRGTSSSMKHWPSRAYEDTALPIGWGQTISQPYIVARMTPGAARPAARPRKVLEVGFGCGYQTAVLAPFAEKMFAIERVEPLVARASMRLKELDVKNVQAQARRRHEGLAHPGAI